MKFDDLAATCEAENKNSAPPIDNNSEMLNSIADKVEQVINSKLEEFNKSVNAAENQPINNSDDNVANNDNAGDDTGNNNSANSSAESE